MRILKHRNYLVKIEYLATKVVGKIMSAKGSKSDKKIHVVAGADTSNEEVLDYLDQHWYEFSDEEKKPALQKTFVETVNKDVRLKEPRHRIRQEVPESVTKDEIEEEVKNKRGSLSIGKYMCSLCGRSYITAHIFNVKGIRVKVCNFCIGAIHNSKGSGKEIPVNFEGGRSKH